MQTNTGMWKLEFSQGRCFASCIFASCLLIYEKTEEPLVKVWKISCGSVMPFSALMMICNIACVIRTCMDHATESHPQMPAGWRICSFLESILSSVYHLSNYISHTRGSISIPCCPWPTRCGGFLFLRPGSVLAGFLASLWGLLLGVYRAHKKTRRPTKTAKARVPRRIAHQNFFTVSLRPVQQKQNHQNFWVLFTVRRAVCLLSKCSTPSSMTKNPASYDVISSF